MKSISGLLLLAIDAVVTYFNKRKENKEQKDGVNKSDSKERKSKRDRKEKTKNDRD